MSNIISLDYRRALRDVHESRKRLDALYREHEWADPAIAEEAIRLNEAMVRLRKHGALMAC